MVAATSKQNPNYFYHWIRDAGLVMLTVQHFNQSLQAKQHMGLPDEYFFSLNNNYAQLTKIHQQRVLDGNMGEPKFYVNGYPYLGPWGRPQNDGPAIRALSLISYAQRLLDVGQKKTVKRLLYDAQLPTQSVIKVDLEYIANQWEKPDFDLWEEIQGYHFFTRLLQRRALVAGEVLARRLNDPYAGDWYREQSLKISQVLPRHWSKQKGYLLSTLDPVNGIDYKSHLDASIILAALYAHDDKDPFFPPYHDHVIATAYQLVKIFKSLYPINHGTTGVPMIGRYPEDRYDGYQTNRFGNPWFLLTNAFAQYYYCLALNWISTSKINVTLDNKLFLDSLLNQKARDSIALYSVITPKHQAYHQIISQLLSQGDAFLERVREYHHQDGQLSEQVNRKTGLQQGAKHLTWSYASFIDAILMRRQVLAKLKK